MVFESLGSTQTLLLALLTCQVGWVVYCRYFHPLCSIPGPLLASFSRTWIVFHTMRGDMEHTQRALHRRYGTICSRSIQILQKLTR